ncbi:MAG TPA: AMP-binding protein [Acidimicrobiales bacterium]|jgi:long-chain acyl-CoA synthetase|nr:AMP-binding protein [Acidimicrobiales bacterium]
MNVLDHAAARPDVIALDDLTRRRTWGELVDRSTRLAHLLRDDLRLEPGTHVASIISNRVEWFELSLATVLSGVWLVPVNTHLQPDEIAYILGDSGARVALVDDAHRPLATAAGATEILGVGAELDHLLDAASDRPIALDGPPGGRMHYTSGTTGRPKGVKRDLPRTAGEYLELLGALGRAVGLDGTGSHLLTGPHYHAAVGGYALFDLCNGASVVLMPRFDAMDVLDHVMAFAIAHAHLVPTMFVRLLRLPDEVRAAFDPSSLTHVLHGAAPIARSTKEAMIEWWGPVLVEYWGTSEGGTYTTISSQEWCEHPGSVGRPLPGIEVVALDDDGTPVAPGVVGTLHCRTGSAPRPFRYHHDDAKTDATYREPGLFTTGDMGRIDADGYVYLADRATNMIISGGVNIYPVEVEAAMVTHPAVADVAVFGVPDEEWGEQVKAAVELAPGYEPTAELAAALIAHARARVAHYKAPKSIDFEATLPRLPSGKLRVQFLKERYWTARDRRI